MFSKLNIARECHFTSASVVLDVGRACATVDFGLRCIPVTGQLPSATNLAQGYCFFYSCLFVRPSVRLSDCLNLEYSYLFAVILNKTFFLDFETNTFKYLKHV